MPSVIDDFIDYRDRIFIGHEPTPIQLLSYDPEIYHEGLYTHYDIHKPTALSAWIPARQAQFLAGRVAANEAMHCLTLATDQVLTGKHRQPLWPANLTGSISHSQQLSIASVKLKQKPDSGLGIDIQTIIDAETQALIAPTIITQDERDLINKSSYQLSNETLFTLVFSAKESFFKALFNTVGAYFDFDTVAIVNIDVVKQQLTLKVINTLDGKLPENIEVDVAFSIVASIAKSKEPQVITICSWEL